MVLIPDLLIAYKIGSFGPLNLAIVGLIPGQNWQIESCDRLAKLEPPVDQIGLCPRQKHFEANVVECSKCSKLCTLVVGQGRGDVVNVVGVVDCSRL